MGLTPEVRIDLGSNPGGSNWRMNANGWNIY